MTKLEVKAKFEAHRTTFHAQRAEVSAKILALRPAWDAAKLAEVPHLYAGTDGRPGLADLLTAIQMADALEARFGGGAK